MNYWLIAILSISALVALYFVVKTVFTTKTHNKLIRLRNKVDNSSAHVEVQLQRRFDLIPNLVEVVKGTALHEQQMIKDLSLLLQKYASASNYSERFTVNDELSQQLNAIYRKVEEYPNIKNNKNFLLLQEQLAEIEEDISFARQFYNDAVTIYNNAIMSYPSNLIAKKYGFEKCKPFNAVKGAENAPQFRFSPLKSNETRCAHCGAVLNPNAAHCQYCGTHF